MATRVRVVVVTVDGRSRTMPIRFDICDACGIEAVDDKALASFANDDPTENMGRAVMNDTWLRLIWKSRAHPPSTPPTALACPNCAPRLRLSFDATPAEVPAC